MKQYKKYLPYLGIIPVLGFVVVFLFMNVFSFDPKFSINMVNCVFDFMGMCVGLGVFFYGFTQLRKKQMIEDIPTSKIVSVAMGLNELKGTAKQKFGVKAPYTLMDCVYYRCRLEVERRNSKGNRYWDVVNEGSSTYYFYLEDNTGKIVVDPLDAELPIKETYCHIEDGIKGRTRYTEWCIFPAEEVYVFGTVRKFNTAKADTQDKIRQRLADLKKDKKALMKYDSDNDGQISVDEWDKAREDIEHEVFKEELRSQVEIDKEDDLVIAKGDAEPTFIICNRSEKDVVWTYAMRGWGSVAGGVAISAGMLVSMLAKIGLLPAWLGIQWHEVLRRML